MSSETTPTRKRKERERDSSLDSDQPVVAYLKRRLKDKEEERESSVDPDTVTLAPSLRPRRKAIADSTGISEPSRNLNSKVEGRVTAERDYREYSSDSEEPLIQLPKRIPSKKTLRRSESPDTKAATSRVARKGPSSGAATSRQKKYGEESDVSSTWQLPEEAFSLPLESSTKFLDSVTGEVPLPGAFRYPDPAYSGEGQETQKDPYSEVPERPNKTPSKKMAPTYSRSQNRRQNRTGLVDHDVYEGLPVKQWRRDYVTVAPPPNQESTNSQNDIWAVELPWGMPKDSHMLPQHSQDLLRAARSGKIYKRPAPVEEEEADPEVIPGDKPEKKDDDLKDKGFMAKAWKQVPRHLEASDVEYLAKRRKGLVTVPAKGTVPAPTLIKATVKRTDAVGNEFLQDVVVPQGQHVEGEVISQTVIPDPNPLAVQPTPPRRKGPVSRKKVKGPGRGRKKKPTAPTSAPATEGIGGAGPLVSATEGVLGPDGVKIENDENATSNQNEDTEMGGGSNAPSDNEEGDEGDEGDDSEDDEGSDSHASPSKATRPSSPLPASLPTMKVIPDVEQVDTAISGTEFAHPLNFETERENSNEDFGSPLKHVALTISSLNSPLESSAIPPFSEPQGMPEDMPSLQKTMQEELMESTPSELPLVPPEPTIKEEIAAVETLKEEDEEEEMLLDIINNANVLASMDLELPASIPVVPAVPEAQVAETDLITADALTAESDLSEPPESRTDDLQPSDSAVQEEEPQQPEATEQIQEEEDDDDFPDLLGSLEASLA